ncbi:hypothetical protein D3C86_1983690 [compost metagenome]
MKLGMSLTLAKELLDQKPVPQVVPVLESWLQLLLLKESGLAEKPVWSVLPKLQIS